MEVVPNEPTERASNGGVELYPNTLRTTAPVLYATEQHFITGHVGVKEDSFFGRPVLPVGEYVKIFGGVVLRDRNHAVFLALADYAFRGRRLGTLTGY